MEIALVHSRRWAAMLVVMAAVAPIAGSATPALAQADGARQAFIPTVEAKPPPSAGWHGRPIRRPYEAYGAQLTTARPRDGAAMRLGAGYGRANGSGPVRRLQRMLLGLGYECGPADGWFGPRTEASVQWFQIKHGVSATGVADAETLRILRFRDSLAPGADRRAAGRSSAIPSPPGWPRAEPAPAHSDERHSQPGVVGSVLLAIVLPLAIAGMALLTRGARRRRVVRRPRTRVRDAARFERHKAAIERACLVTGRLDHLVADRLVAAARNGGANDAHTAPRRRRADTPGQSRVKRGEPIDAAWRRKRPWR